MTLSKVTFVLSHTTREDAEPILKVNMNSSCMQGNRDYTSNSKINSISTVINKTSKAKVKLANRDTTDDKQSQEAIINQRQTVNPAKVVWDPIVKPKGIFEGHFNIRSLFSKCDEIRIVLLGSNLDFFCISETWQHHKLSTSMIDVPG